MTLNMKEAYRQLLHTREADRMVERLAKKLAQREITINEYMRLCRCIRGEFTE